MEVLSQDFLVSTSGNIIKYFSIGDLDIKFKESNLFSPFSLGHKVNIMCVNCKIWLVENVLK